MGIIQFSFARKYVRTGDNFDTRSSHVIPALIKKFYDAKLKMKKCGHLGNW